MPPLNLGAESAPVADVTSGSSTGSSPRSLESLSWTKHDLESRVVICAKRGSPVLIVQMRECEVGSCAVSSGCRRRFVAVVGAGFHFHVNLLWILMRMLLCMAVFVVGEGSDVHSLKWIAYVLAQVRITEVSRLRDCPQKCGFSFFCNLFYLPLHLVNFFVSHVLAPLSRSLGFTVHGHGLS